MIQRKQTLWLFIAALLNAGVLYFDLYKVDAPALPLRVMNHYPSLLITLVITILPLITIFMFGNRKRQISMSIVSMLATCSFITMLLTRVTNLGKLTPPPTNGSYGAGAVLPVIAIIFIILAIVGIRRDEKLVKSVDRLR